MNVAILGYGVVGSGVAEVFKLNHEKIVKKSEQESLELKYILDLRDFPGDPFENLVIHNFDTILKDDSVKIVVETMGGVTPAYEWELACLKAGKSVVTSNKELVAAKGCELLRVAKENNVNFLFEASTGGGIPLLRPINQCLAANEIEEVAGILNGTTNYILTKMFTEGVSFDDALKTAQELGYAERNPSADVDGLDAGRKICILAALCFGTHIYPDGVHTEGIRGITAADVSFAENNGYVIKLIGSAKKIGENVQIMVSPAFIKDSSPLAAVNDVFNGVLVKGNAVGDVMFYGRGAGKLPTASAVVADVIDCAKHSEKRAEWGWDDAKEGYALPYEEFVSSFYVRLCGDAEKAAKTVSADSFTAISGDEFVIVTPEISRRELEEKLNSLGEAIKVNSIIRISDY